MQHKRRTKLGSSVRLWMWGSGIVPLLWLVARAFALEQHKPAALRECKTF